MSQGVDWRSPDAAKYYENHDNADFAQEFLRRNPDYREDYQSTKKDIKNSGGDEKEEMEVLARRWGMIFPFRPEPRRDFCPRDLDAIYLFSMRHIFQSDTRFSALIVHRQVA